MSFQGGVEIMTYSDECKLRGHATSRLPTKEKSEGSLPERRELIPDERVEMLRRNKQGRVC